MAILRLSLSAEATGRIYESLVCLAKFGESLSLEAKKDKARPLKRPNDSTADRL